ncbi:MAG: DUF2239 family protein [Porphyrobacter sp.]|nr:DUF2239 family protein [Porphyrobacter sp.]
MGVTVFHKGELLTRGTAEEVAPQMRALEPLERASDLLVFDDDTGRQIDIDLREEESPRTRGRPSLGVKAREVTLLPRHWDWLNAQRGGASAALRRLVEEASKHGKSPEQSRDAAYRFLSAIAGDFPMFEDAVRELYAGNQVGYDHFTYDWPAAIRDHGRRLAFPG